MNGPVRIKGYDEIIEALDEARTTAGYLSDWCVKTINENEALRARVASLEHAARSLLSRDDFWRDAGTLPGEYDNLVDALAAAPKEEAP